MSMLKQSGINTVGYLETAISMAGWGVSWVAKELGMEAVIFDPQYSDKHPAKKIHDFHRSKWQELGSTVISIKPFMTKVNFYIVKDRLKEFPNSKMLPLGLPLMETMDETAAQVQSTDISEISTIIICVGSGTICAGVLKGLSDNIKSPAVIGVMSRTGNRNQKEQFIRLKSGTVKNGLLKCVDFRLINPGWEYIDREQLKTPFPCNPYYDQKALRFLLDGYNRIKKPILFWNIGGPSNEE